MKKKIGCILLVLATLLALGYVRQVYLDSQAAQQEVVHKFINVFYNHQYTGEVISEEEIEKRCTEAKPLLSKGYAIDSYDLEWLVISSDYYRGSTLDYSGYSIGKKIKAKSKGKKVTVYIVNVEYVDKGETVSPKSLYIELLKEESQWKINKLMPYSA